MTTRKPLIAGNWKMHLDHLESIQLVQRLSYHLDREDYDAVDVAVCPSFTSLRSIQTLIDGDKLPIALGAQDVHPEPQGAHTGEVSAPMLAKLDCAYVIVGHSERRADGEDDALVSRKVAAVAANAMVPILCVGETLAEREAGDAEAVVESQLRGSLAGADPQALGGWVVAYEPVWAIGTGKTASADDAAAMCGHVRGIVDELSGGGAGEVVRVLYGGSVKPGNVVELMGRADIDGALVGGASLDADDFAIICRHHRLR